MNKNINDRKKKRKGDEIKKQWWLYWKWKNEEIKLKTRLIIINDRNKWIKRMKGWKTKMK